ncbi:hypothetical protein OQA88_7067 [Cercophora sp. LCS_1]
MSNSHEQARNLPLLATRETCAGRTYIVTGANSGLGFEASKHLVSLGAAKVIMAVRNLQAGNTARAKIEADTGITNVAEVWRLDLADYDSVKTFARRAIDELSRIDGVINNASVASSARELVNGQNANVSINIIGTFLLTILLLPKLTESAEAQSVTPRVVVVGSRAGFDVKELWGKIQDDPLEKMKDDDVYMAAYPLSKLVETFAARQLAKLLPVSKTGVVLNVVCPGICVTELDRSAPEEFRKRLAEVRSQIGRTAEDGSRTLLHGVVAGEDTHGLLLHSCQVGESDIPDWAIGEEGRKGQEKSWDVVVAELERVEPGCVKSILN